MKDYITNLLEALMNYDGDRILDIYYGVRDGNITVEVEDIVSLCKIYTYEFLEMQSVDEQLILKMTFYIIRKCELKKGLEQLVKGFKEIYTMNYDMKKIFNNSMDEDPLWSIVDYLRAFIHGFNEAEIVLLGKLINLDDNKQFKEKIIDLLEKDFKIKRNDEYMTKENILIKSISLNL